MDHAHDLADIGTEPVAELGQTLIEGRPELDPVSDRGGV
jgi:hypothetical protein